MHILLRECNNGGHLTWPRLFAHCGQQQVNGPASETTPNKGLQLPMCVWPFTTLSWSQCSAQCQACSHRRKARLAAVAKIAVALAGLLSVVSCPKGTSEQMLCSGPTVASSRAEATEVLSFPERSRSWTCSASSFANGQRALCLLGKGSQVQITISNAQH